MDVITTVVGKIVEVLTDRFLTSMGRRIGYAVHYKKIIVDLNAEVQNLRGVRGRIEGKVDTAKNNGEVIENDVLNWQREANKKEDDLNSLLEDKENIKSCFDVRSRYRLGREGKKLLSDISRLIEGGKFDTVGHPAPLVDIWYTPTTNFEHFESRESLRKQIIEVLKDNMNYIIGIHGMAGTGKTTMAEEIAKQVETEKLFDEVAKAVFSQNPDLKKIQKELAECLNMTSFKTDTEDGRKGELYNRLKNGKKILVIIDDIWNDEIELEKIGIPSNDNCKVLLTSREEDVCFRMGVQKNFQIKLLQEHEAWNLFKKTVGDFIEYTNGIDSVAKQVCRECDRLPLAIRVVGAALRNQKQKHMWDDALGQLRNCRGHNIKGVAKELYSRIEWSYEYLKLVDARSCFLHCSLFPEDAEISIDDLVMYGVGTRFLMDSLHTMKAARDRTLVLVDTLKNSYLLFEGKSKDFVKMHDIIRDVSISIALREGFLAKTSVLKWPEKLEYESCKVISLRSKNISELPHELECPELRTLVLECNYNCKSQVPDSFFKGMEKLEVLDLSFVRLPSSPLNLVNLRILRLYGCDQVDLAFLKELRNLEILIINDNFSDIKLVAVKVGHLTSLRWLDLNSCTKLKIIPAGSIKSLSNIEELYFPYEFGGWGNEGNAGLDELNSLTHLTTLQIHIGDGLVLPNERCFESLNRFKISIGMTSGFGYNEEKFGAKMLKLDDITLRREFNILMEKADVLILKGVKGLKNVLHSGDGKGFLESKYLNIADFSDMEHLLGRPKWNLPTQVIFHQLKKMRLVNLPILKSIYQSTTECSISTDAQALFNEKVSFPALEELDITKLDSVSTIWDNQLLVSTSFERLTSLSIDGCRSLRNVFSPSIARNLWQLQDLRVRNCEKIEEIITVETVQGEEEVTDDEIVVFHQLKEMKLERLPNLKSFWSGSKKAAAENDIPQVQALFNHKVSTSFERLTSLCISQCRNLRNVFSPSIAKNLQQLQELTVSNCEKIEEIVAVEKVQGEEEVTGDEIIVFPQLKKMILQRLPNLKTFWSSSCGSNKEVEDDIPQVHALFNYKVKFPSLENFEYRWNKNNLKEIWSCTVPIDAVCKLRKLTIYDCDKLLSIAPPSKLLQNLEVLFIYGCPNLEKVSTSFKRLTSLSISECRNLRNVFSPSIAKNLQQLQELKVSFCQKIEEIIAIETVQREEEVTGDEIIVFPQLKKMILDWLPNLKSFWSSTCGSNKEVEDDIPQVHALFNYKVKFPSLEIFEYTMNTNNLKEIWSSTVPIDAVCKLRKLTVYSCDKLLSIAPPSKLLQNLEELHISYCPNLEKVSTSFVRLTSLSIYECHNLRNIFSASIAKNLQQLLELTVSECKKIEEIIAVEKVQGEEEVTGDEIIVFPQLKKMELGGLPNLKSFWSSTYGSKKEVEDDIPQVHALFNYKVKFPSLEKFYHSGGKNHLKKIWNTTVPIDSFCKLRSLTVGDCDELLSVAPSKLLGSLKELSIYNCPSLEEIFKVEGRSNNAEEGIVVARDKDIEEDLETISELPFLVKMRITHCPKLKSTAFYTSKEKVTFPVLEDLTLSDGSIFEDIWYGHVPVGSFSKVRNLTVANSNMLVNVFTLLQRFEVVEKLTVRSCSSLEVVFNLEGLEDRKRGATVSSQIMDSEGLLTFHNLRFLTVESCNSLKYLFSLSMARNLTEIEYLSVEYCDAIEEVIRNEDQGEEDGLMDEIVFPKLQSIHLRYLKNLTSFCGANNAFKLPALTRVMLIDCPKMKTFTYGRISTQLIELIDNYDSHEVSDLNKYVEQCIEKRKGRDAEETSVGNEIEETSEETNEIKDDEETS